MTSKTLPASHWFLTVPVTGEAENDGQAYRIRERDGGRTVVLTWALGLRGTETADLLLTDGEFVDFGDEFPVVMGLLDELEESGASEPYSKQDSGACDPHLVIGCDAPECAR